METILDLANEVGFEPVKDLEGCGPVPDEEALENIRKSILIDIPVFKKQPYRSGTIVYVGGGPSMPSHLEEIRQKKEDRYFIITSNMTNDWLVDRGIIPDAVLLIDPKERVSRYVQKPQKETKFYVGTLCNEGVAKGLLEKGAYVEKILIGYGMDGERDVALHEELYPNVKDYLIGGTMSGLRIMNFAIMLGFRKIEIYGVDSCYGSEPPKFINDDDPLYQEAIASNEGAFYEDPRTKKRCAVYDPPDGGWFYAYKKKHHGALQIAKCPDGRAFWTSPVFAHQAKQFIKWYDRLEGKLEVIVHGDNLTAHLLNCHIKGIERRKKKVGEKRWSNKYKPLFHAFFLEHDHCKYPENIEKVIHDGAAALSDSLGREVTILNYDKHVLEDKVITEPHDIVFSVNTLEHFEQECIDNVLKEIKQACKYMAIFNVSLAESKELLGDGSNAHITLKAAQWWEKKLTTYFDIVEGQWKGGDYGLFICQSLNAHDNQKGEKLNGHNE